MRVKGKVLRVLSAGPGLVMIEGRQYRFTAAEWRSASCAFPGAEIEALLNESRHITEIVLASEGLIGREDTGRVSLWRMLHWLRGANRKKTEGRS